jgi:hypothetical protein
MRSFLLSLVVAMSLPALASAQQDEARAIIERAVEAQGGLERLSQKAAAHRKVKGHFHSDDYRFTGESFSEGDTRRKLVLHGKGLDARKGFLPRTLVLDGDKGWRNFYGETETLDSEFIARLKRAIYADRVAGLVTLLRDKGYTLTLLGESDFNGTALVGVKVQSAGQADIELFFDKKTHLLFKAAQRIPEPGNGKEVLQEVYYSDYQRLDPAARDAALLKAAGLGVDGPALFDFLHKRTFAPGERQRIDELVKQLGDGAFKVREKASAALQALGLKAAPSLRAALKHGDLELVRRAEKLLAALGQGPELPQTVAVLRLIALRRPAGASEALLGYLPWAPDERVTREVQEALAAVAVQDGKEDPVLVAALKDADPQRRAAAAAALGRDGGKYLQQGWRRVVIEGVLIPRYSVVYQDRQRLLDLELVEVEYYNRLDDAVFARP